MPIAINAQRPVGMPVRHHAPCGYQAIEAFLRNIAPHGNDLLVGAIGNRVGKKGNGIWNNVDILQFRPESSIFMGQHYKFGKLT